MQLQHSDTGNQICECQSPKHGLLDGGYSFCSVCGNLIDDEDESMRSVNDHPADGVEVLPVIQECVDAIAPHLEYPVSIIDFGCGAGFWCKAFRAYTDGEILGIDSQRMKDHYYKNNSDDDGDGWFLDEDLREPLDLKWRSDLALCLETAEHLEPEYADTLIDTICRHSDTVLFSAATPGQGGWKHLNEQPHEYWIEKFAARGYECDTSVRDVLPESAPSWYKKNMMVFRRK